MKAYYNACKAKKHQWEYIRNWEVFLDLPILDKQKLPLCYRCLTNGHLAHACRLPISCSSCEAPTIDHNECVYFTQVFNDTVTAQQTHTKDFGKEHNFEIKKTMKITVSKKNIWTQYDTQGDWLLSRQLKKATMKHT